MYQQHNFLGRRSVLAIEMKTTIFCEVCANGHACTQYIIIVQWWVLHLLAIERDGRAVVPKRSEGDTAAEDMDTNC